MDVPAPVAGRVLEVKVAVGGKVSAGDVLMIMQPSAAAPAGRSGRRRLPGQRPPAPARAPRRRRGRPAARAAPSGRSAVSSSPTSFAEAHASPSVRKLGRELGVDLGRVRGSGAKGRVTADDVKAFVKEIMQGGGAGGVAWPAVPNVDFAKYGPRRDRAAVAHPEDLGPAPARELGQHPARHAARRGGHHGARGEARRAEAHGARSAASSSRRWRSSSAPARSRSPRCRSSSRRSRPTARAS